MDLQLLEAVVKSFAKQVRGRRDQERVRLHALLPDFQKLAKIRDSKGDRVGCTQSLRRFCVAQIENCEVSSFGHIHVSSLQGQELSGPQYSIESDLQG